MNCSLITVMFLLVISQLASAKVVLIGENTILSFEYVEATFTPIVRRSGEYGSLYAAERLDACSDLTNMAEKGSRFRSSYVLIVRGGCSFEEKVRKAQTKLRLSITINGYDELLVPRNSSGVHIHGLLVTRASGDVLKGYSGRSEMELWLIPGFGISLWSIMCITFISLLTISAVLATCFVFHMHRIRRSVRDLHLPYGGQGLSRMPRNLLQSMPTEVYTGVLEESSTSVTCAICIDDYCVGEKLKILPCKHKFHAVCIDSWLGHCRSFCPVCKRMPRTGNDVPPASETTPLLSPSPNSITSLQSFYDLPIAVRVYLDTSGLINSDQLFHGLIWRS